MNDHSITIKQASIVLGVNAQTLRRWDNSGVLKAKRNESHRWFYQSNDLEEFLKAGGKYLVKTADQWAGAKNPPDLLDAFYCPDRSIFKARLSRLESELKSVALLENVYSLITAVAGEIGNNSFDHNLGNWPDAIGIFFGYSVKEKTIVLADRGQGILTTLNRVKKNLTTHQDALKTAFTEIISGRAPENRGNGLKFVREVVVKNDFELFFQSGDAVLLLNNKNEKIIINKSDNYLRGCFAKLTF